VVDSSETEEVVVHELPGAGRLAAWGTAALTGACSLDEAADAVTGPHDAAHRVLGLPGEGTPVTLAYALGRLRFLGAAALRLVLTRPGDPSGLPGPKAFTEGAVAGGAAVVAVGAEIGLLPAARGDWQTYVVEPDRRTPLSIHDAERALGAVVRDAAEVLAALDVARWDPAAADVISRGTRAASSPLPPSAPPAAHALLARSLRLASVLEVAQASEGAAVSGTAMTARRQVLRDLDTAVRRAVEAACSPPPPG